MEMFEMFAKISGAMSLISLVLCIIIVAATWKIFVKAGRPGWHALIPFYSTYVQFELFWGKGWKMLLMFVPIVGFFVMIMANFKMAKAFGKGAGFGLLLLLFSPIALPMLAFGDAQYIGPQ